MISHLAIRTQRSGMSPWGMMLLVLVLGVGRGGGATPEVSNGTNSWWSLKPVVRPALPEGTSGNPIDRWIDAELRAQKLSPAGAADPRVLLRRVYLDLIGIPPTPAQQREFLADRSSNAYEKVVDRLLADEQHAVRYARHWLDVMRYADSDERMPAAPGIHLWRDWVIQALHEDLPYNEFVQVQLTGRRSSERSQMSATGHRSQREPRPGDLFALGFLARGAAENPQDLAIAAVETVSTAFMGMTVGCAKCHDHMYDPIAQKDFYAMKSLFDPLVLRKVSLASASELLAAGKAMAALEKKRAPAQKALDDFLAPFKKRLYEERLVMLPAEVQAVIRKPEKDRTVAEQKIADDYFPILRIDGDKVNEIMTKEEREKRTALQSQLDATGAGDEAGRRVISNIPVFYTVEVDRVREQEQFYFLNSGDPARPQKKHPAQPGWPFSHGDLDFRDGRVEAFTDWLTAPENPLFARVAVNRIWQWHFGQGIHKLSSDFGVLGGRPSDQAMLDWLAAEFVSQKYSMKAMHRLIVTSNAYKRATEFQRDWAGSNLLIDPDNEHFWHFPLLRLEAEAIWDSIHSAAGILDLKVGGRSFEVAHEGERGGKRAGDLTAAPEVAPVALVRRGVYMTRGYSASRDVTSSFLQSFDVDDGREPCPLRTRTVTAPQALFLMNSAEIEKASRVLADHALKVSDKNLTSAVQNLYELTLSRAPSSMEMDRAMVYLDRDPARLKHFAWLLLNLDEFIYVR